MTKKIKENKISQISDVEHVILRSGIYIGSTEPVHASTFFYNEKSGMFEYKEFDYIPAFCKIINEIIDNSLDEAIRTNFKYGNEIQVTITEDTVTVKDNGRGVPTDIDPATGISQLELAFTRARAGSNFDDSDRSTIGQNGVGSFCTNCFSKSFIVKSVTKKQKGTLTCTDNVSTTKCRIVDNEKGKETGTIVEFVPDLKKFKMKKIDATHINIIYQRLLFLSVSYPEISFKFNKKNIRFKTNKAFLNHFDEHNTFVAGENYLIGVIPNTFDDFISKSFVNGADCINGGNHIDYIHSEVVGRLKEKLERKYPSIKPGDIKNKLTYIITFRDFNNAKFDSQTKEKLANNVNDVKEYLKEVDWDKLATGIYKNEAIMNPIIESFKIKEELKNRQTLNKISKTKGTFKCEKFFPATEENKYIFISEGDCLEENTLIYNTTENKCIPIKDCNVGDMVLTHNNRFKPITAKNNVVKECVKINIKGNEPIICSKEHRLFVYDTTTNTFKFKKAKNINIKTDKLVKNIAFKGLVFDTITIEKQNKKEFPYIIKGKVYSFETNATHKFMVFNTETMEFYLKNIKQINSEKEMFAFINE